MISFFVCELFDFGCPFTEEHYEKINAQRRKDFPHMAGLKAPYPGIDHLHYGKDREGYWTSDCFLEQVKDYLYCMDVILDKRYQIWLEVDSSSGHLKKKEQGLGARNVKWGGVQKRMRDSVMVEGCIDTSSPTCILVIGGVQYMQFKEGDAPPIGDAKARRKDLKWSDMSPEEQITHGPKRDVFITQWRAKKKKKEKNNRSNRFVAVIDDSAPENLPEFILIGFEGKPKGMMQILQERGLWKNGMHKAYDAATVKKKTDAGIVIDSALDADAVLLACPDFAQEETLLEELCHSFGAICLLSPKCHPELAGVGVEYCIGFSKMQFRRKHNDTLNAHLHDNTITSIKAVTIDRVWKFARRARDYLHVYQSLMVDGVIDSDGFIDLTGEEKMSYEKLENMRKHCKTHRNIHHLELNFLKKEDDVHSNVAKQQKKGRNRIPDVPAKSNQAKV